VFDNPFARRGPCPRFDNTTVTIPRREVDGFSGRVVLSLVNQRLWMVQFFPDEPVRYIQWIQGRKTPPGAAEPRMITGNIKTGSKEPAPLVGVGWIDRKLAAERTAWLESCT
jgi:hypothetical protein